MLVLVKMKMNLKARNVSCQTQREMPTHSSHVTHDGLAKNKIWQERFTSLITCRYSPPTSLKNLTRTHLPISN